MPTALRTSKLSLLAAHKTTSKLRTSDLNLLVGYVKPAATDLNNILVQYVYKPATGNVYNESASSSFSLSGTASCELVRTVSSSITLTVEATQEVIRPAFSNIVLAVEALPGYVPLQVASDTLVVSTEATADLFPLQAVESILVLDGTATFFTNIRVGSLVQFTQDAIVNTVLNRDIISTVNINSSVSLNKTIQLNASNSFTPSVTVAFKKAVPVSASSTFSLSTSASDFRHAFNVITLSGIADGYLYFLTGTATSTLTLAVTASAENELTRNCLSSIVLAQDAYCNLIRERSTSSQLAFTDSSGNTTLHGKTFVILQAPFGSVQDTLILPAPLLDNKVSNPDEVIVRRSIVSGYRTYIKTNNRTKMKFVFQLSRRVAAHMKYFVTQYNGDFIYMQDWVGKKWKVKIITNPVVFTENSPFLTDVELELEGVQIHV